MNKISCMIVDDEQFSLDKLCEYAQKVPFLNLVHATTSSIDALTKAKLENIELIFSDIHMTELTGIDFAKNVSGKSKVIFITAYPEYALQGYEIDVVDYVVKPLSFERFLQSAEKARKLIESERILAIMNRQKEASEFSTQGDFIFVKSDKKMIKINFEDILYIEGSKNYIFIYTSQYEKIITLLNMKDIENILPQNLFMRIHKSYIISLNRITAIEGNDVFLGKVKIPLGTTFRTEFLSKFSGKIV